jgi:hypothetical protein
MKTSHGHDHEISNYRLSNPQSVEGMIIIVVAAIGVIINTVTALLFISGQKHDLNIKGAYLHMAADAGVSLGVVVAGIAIMITGWLWPVHPPSPRFCKPPSFHPGRCGGVPGKAAFLPRMPQD